MGEGKREERPVLPSIAISSITGESFQEFSLEETLINPPGNSHGSSNLCVHVGWLCAHLSPGNDDARGSSSYDPAVGWASPR